LFDLPTPVVESPADLPAAAGGRPRCQHPQRRQVEFQPFSLDELLPADHDARAVWEYVQGVDLSDLYGAIRAVEGVAGRDPIDPRILLALWLYATLDGVGSARQLDELCRDHIAYRWICGGVSVNYHTLSDFRTAHPELLDEMLTDSVATLMNEGLVTLNRVAEDGMRVRASAGSDSFHRAETLEKHLATAREQIERLKQELEQDPGTMSARQQAAQKRAAGEREARLKRALEAREKIARQREDRKKGSGEEARASGTDPDARRMKMADGGTRPAYNVQFSTDTGSLVTTGVIVTNLGSDAGGMTPMIQQHVERYGKAPGEILTDGGFSTIDDIEQVEGNHVTVVYTPVKEEQKKRAKGIDPFAPCRGDSEVIARWRQRMGTESAAEIYKERAASAEWTNAQARNRGLRQFLVRGVEKVKAVALWYAVANNLRRALALRAPPAMGTQ
jgi:transposase